MRKIAVIGAGGHAASVIDCISRDPQSEFVGVIVRQSEDAGSYPVFCLEADLSKIEDVEIHIGIGSIGDTSLRHRMEELVRQAGLPFACVIDPSAVISADTVLEEGIFISKGAIINSGCRIGRQAIINSGAILEHGVQIGAFSHIAPGAVLAGDVVVGRDSHIGLHSSVLQGLSIGDSVMVGAHSFVRRSVSSGHTVFGVPAKERV